MRLIKVNNFKCSNCGSEEYAVLDPYGEPIIICDKCGIEQNVEFEIEEMEEN